MIKKWLLFSLKIIPYLIPFLVTLNLSIEVEFKNIPFEQLNLLLVYSSFILLLGLIIEKIVFNFVSYLDIAIFIDYCVILLFYYTYPQFSKLILSNIVASIYFPMFIVSVFPQLLGFPPFTFEFAKPNVPKSVSRMDKFCKIQNIISFFWGGIFFISFVISVLPLPGYFLFYQKVFPILIMAGVGIPFSVYSPDYFNSILPNNTPFESAYEALEALPFALNKKETRELHKVIQFDVTGDEIFKGYIEISSQKAKFIKGEHENPDCIIHVPANIWIDITSNRLEGATAYLERKMKVDKDPTIVKKLDMFFYTKPTPKIKKIKKSFFSNYPYATTIPGSIKKVLVLDGGPRDESKSKTKMMVNAFCEGLKKAGVEVKTIHLTKRNVKPCIGCYSCRVKTPGTCIFKDDMTDILEQYKEADVILLSSPLYYNTFSAQLKGCLDRLLPILLLYKKEFDEGILFSSNSSFKKKQGIVVFSAGGNNMPVEQNFLGLSYTIRTFVSQFYYIYELLGEFYLPASERLSDPAFQDRIEKMVSLMNKAGNDIAQNGRIDIKDMESISNQCVSEREAAYFNQQHQNMFFRILEKERKK